MIDRIKIFLFCLFSVALFSYLILSIGNKQNIKTVSSDTLNSDDLVLIIDAGHGGTDGGAVSSDGTLEADINLQIAEKLRDVLTVLGYKTVMTRSDGNSLGDSSSSVRNEKVSDIHKRMDIMNSFENCLFISIHQNYYQGSSSSGTQVFYSGNNDESFALAESVQSSVISLIQPENHRKIKKSGSGIYLLYKAQKPAVMVECGFLSDANETKKLKDNDYQLLLALSISNGIMDYTSQKDV